MRLLNLSGVSSLGAVSPPRGLSVPGSAYNSKVRAVVKYLVTKRLAGDVKTLLAVKEVLVDWRPPADVAAKYRLKSKYVLRGWVQRLIEKAGSERFAKEIVARAWRPIYRTPPIVILMSGGYYCLECRMPVTERPETHVRRYHKLLLEAAVERVLEKALNGRKR